LIETEGSPFAPSETVRPVVDVIDGRRTNDDLAPSEWVDALEASAGAVAIYFEIPADAEWWLGYDPAFEGDGQEGEGPFVCWSTYPSGPWEQSRLSGEILTHNIEMLGEGCEGCGIRRSRVVRVEDAPEFVQSELRQE